MKLLTARNLQAGSISVVCVVAGCGGGSSGPSADADAGADASAGGGSSGGSDGSSGSGADGPASSGGSSSGGSGSGPSSSSGSGGEGGSGGSSEADGGSPDASPQDGAADGQGGLVSVICGKETDGGNPSRCSAGEICCVDAAAVPATYACQAQGVPCSGTVVSCASASDCPQAQSCCGVLLSAGYYSGLSCADDCVTMDGGSPYHFCDLDAPVCPPSKTCRASMFLPGYGICE